MTAREALPVLCRDIGPTVEIPVDRHPLDFDLDIDEALAMFHAARRSATSALNCLAA